MVTRSDLTTQYQVPQVVHAVTEFAIKHPTEHKVWYDSSNSLVVLAVDGSEHQLYNLALDLEQRKNQQVVRFYEPDIGYELTAFAVVPTSQTKKLLSGIPLAGKRTVTNAQELLQRKWDVVESMQQCEQFPGLNTLEHGLSVWNYLNSILQAFKTGTMPSSMCAPEWLRIEYKQFLEACMDLGEWKLRTYCVWHDCGKHVCKTVSEDGKTRFPDHAKRSAELYSVGLCGGPQVAWFIGHDMDMWLLKPSEAKQYATNNEHTWKVQWIVALAELNANAELFGGCNTDSFKIKAKRLFACGKNMLGL